MDLSKLDWIDIIGMSIADLLGPAGVPLKAALRIRSDLRVQANAEVARIVSTGYVDEATQRNLVGLLGIEPSGHLQLHFSVSFASAWQRFQPSATFPNYARATINYVWSNEASFRRSLAELVFEPDEIRLVCRDAQVDLSRVRLAGTSEGIWYSVFDYLRGQQPGRVLYLLFILSLRHPAHVWLKPWERTYELRN